MTSTARESHSSKNANEMLTALDSDVIVGKDILELLSSSMYVEPLTIFREYVQNSADAIDEAVDKGILEASAGRIEIETDPTSNEAFQ